MWKWCEDVKMWRCEDVKMWRCEDVKMWRCEDVRMWGCEDVKMRRWEDVRIWRWICQDVKMRRWEDVMKMWWRCEHMKMYSKPLLLEEPFAQTLSGKNKSSQITNLKRTLKIHSGSISWRTASTNWAAGQNEWPASHQGLGSQHSPKKWSSEWCRALSYPKKSLRPLEE